MRNEKDPHQAAMERLEAERICAEIKELTAKIPPRLLSGGSVNLVRQYKKVAAKAIAAADQKSPSLGKLRSVFNEIRSFY
ncbi:MAG: hypothetical protein GAK35_02625 [Herbaspirillum frisingense]|uniref:Uncharacterized protein n=1 Tax=Herbaspirillum frisingense TaxID=92645 RepID=A0A7V8FVS8_9BURK|nr:MAG: hypothetical protein GAK35_02625 [Herbaspirillum frisingense]